MEKGVFYRGIDVSTFEGVKALADQLAADYVNKELLPILKAGGPRKGRYYIVDEIEHDAMIAVNEMTEEQMDAVFVSMGQGRLDDIEGRRGHARLSRKEYTQREKNKLLTALYIEELMEDFEQLDQIMVLFSYPDDTPNDRWEILKKKALEVAQGKLDDTIHSDDKTGMPVWDEEIPA